jgi:hypothetical protein
MVPGAHGNENPNSNYMNGRGFWLFYVLVLGGVHLILLSVPIQVKSEERVVPCWSFVFKDSVRLRLFVLPQAFSVAWVWTLTAVGHNAISFWFLHWVSGRI